MPSFRYKAVTASGTVDVGVVESGDRFSAISDLQARGLLPIEADEVAAAARPGRLRWQLRAKNTPARQLGLMLQELSVSLHAGLPLDTALDLLAEQPSAKSMQLVMTALLKSVQQGASLAEAVAAHPNTFPASVSTLIEAGEAGGTLDLSLDRAAEMLLGAAALRETILGALLYPIILLVVAGLSLTIILTAVIPEFKPLFEDAGAKLPLPTLIVMGIGDFIGDYWWVGLTVAIALYAGISRVLRRAPIRLAADARLLTVPILGPLLAKIETARFARTLGTLVDNGIPLPSALGITFRGFRNVAMAKAVERVAISLKEGEGLAAPLEATKLFPRSALHLIRVGEETARLGDMLNRLALILERDVQRGIQRTLGVAVPLVTVSLGVLIAGIIASILVAVLSVNDLAM